MSNKLIAVLWFLAGLVGAKVLNELLYPVFNNASTGISAIRAFIPALISVVFLMFCFYRGYMLLKNSQSSENLSFDKLLNITLPASNQSKLIWVLIATLVFLLIATNFDSIKKAVSGEKIYDVYSCIDPVSESKNECQRELKMTAKFLVDINRQNVLIEYTRLENQKKSLVKLPNCTVIDAKNWKCGGVMKTESYGLSYDGAFQMIDGQMQTTDSIVGRAYIKANFFKLR